MSKISSLQYTYICMQHTEINQNQWQLSFWEGEERQRERRDCAVPPREDVVLNESPAGNTSWLWHWIVSLWAGHYKSRKQSPCQHEESNIQVGSLNLICWTQHISAPAVVPAQCMFSSMRLPKDRTQSYGHQQHTGVKWVSRLEENPLKGKTTKGAVYCSEKHSQRRQISVTEMYIYLIIVVKRCYRM